LLSMIRRVAPTFDDRFPEGNRCDRDDRSHVCERAHDARDIVIWTARNLLRSDIVIDEYR